MSPMYDKRMLRQILPLLALLLLAESASAQMKLLSSDEHEPAMKLLESTRRIPLRLASKDVQESADPLVKLVWETRETQRRRLLSTSEHTPWQIMHALLGLRQDLLLLHEGKVTNGLDWILTGPLYQSECWFEKTESGGRAHPFSKPYWFEGHVNQFLSMLASCRLPLATEFRTENGTITMKDMLRHAQMNVTSRGEVTWTLWALATYLPSDARWVNNEGEDWSIEKLVELEVGKPVGGPTSPCGGTHGLFALAQARNVYLRSGRPLTGVWFEADQKIRRYVQTTRILSNPDGSLSSSYFKAREVKPEFDKRVGSQGHLLEFLMMSVSQEELQAPWVRKAIELLCRELMDNRTEYVRCSPLYHSTNALTIYLERMAAASKMSAPAKEAEQAPPGKSVSRTRLLAPPEIVMGAEAVDASGAEPGESVPEAFLEETAAAPGIPDNRAASAPARRPANQPQRGGDRPPVPDDDIGFPPFPPLDGDSEPAATGNRLPPVRESAGGQGAAAASEPASGAPRSSLDDFLQDTPVPEVGKAPVKSI